MPVGMQAGFRKYHKTEYRESLGRLNSAPPLKETLPASYTPKEERSLHLPTAVSANSILCHDVIGCVCWYMVQWELCENTLSVSLQN